MSTKTYEVSVIEAVGSCDSDIFKEMASNGDLQSTKVKDAIGSVVTINGYATCHIKTSEKEFDMSYYSTNEGILSTGSEVFKDSLKKYYGKIDTFKIVEIKTNRGTSFKVTPVL